MLKRLKQILYVLIAYFLVHTIMICIDGFTDDTDKASVAIVLGTTVNEDGSLSERLKARLDAGLDLYNNELIDTFYVSGGFGKEGHLEGTKMKAYLVQIGVASDKIFVDNKGNNTRATAVNFKNDFPQIKNIYVVSQFFHISRTKLALNQVGVEQVYGTHADYFEWRDLYSTFREFFGYYVYWIKY